MMLQTVFLKILNMSLTSALVIFLVLAARLLFKKAPKRYVYLFWSVALFRLVCPFSLESVFSILPSSEVVPRELLTSANSYDWSIHTGFAAIDQAVNPVLYDTSPSALVSNFTIFSWIWLAGVAAMAVYILLSLIRLRRTVTGAVRLQDRIYLADHIASPFVAGVFRPKIYLPSSLSVQERQYILLHEQAHIRRFDPLFRVLAFIALSLHWFNPLVWAAFYLSGRDMEMACDETVMRQMENDIRREYAQSLLDRTTGKRIAPGIPLAFGETNIKARIRNIMSYRKSSRWVITAAVVVLAALCIGLALNPAKSQRAAITFPAYQDGKSEYNESIYNIRPFTLHIDLPEGWSAAFPAPEERGASPAGFTPVYLMEGSTAKAVISYNTFELYEGDIPLEDFYKTVYAPLRLGSLYRWEDYTPIVSSKTTETALATVYYSEEMQGQSAASWPQSTTPGILFYDKERLIYLAIQFSDSSLSLDQLHSMAQSVRMTDAK